LTIETFAETMTVMRRVAESIDRELCGQAVPA